MLKKYPVLFLPAFLAIWIFISYLLSSIGGWSNLAKYYSAQNTFQGDKWYLQSLMSSGLVSYRSCVTVGTNHKSIYLAVLFPFR